MSAPFKPVNKWLVAISVMLPTVMEIIDTSVANVALPHMQGSLNAGTDEITWVLTSYLVANAVILPITGWLARLFGRKRFLITCIILFTLASFLCGAAPNLEMLVFFRILQGAAGGALIPNSQAIMMETFPPQERGMAMAIFGVGAMTGPIVGPALGGWVTDQLDWRWIFYINIPVGVIAVILVSYFIFDPPYLQRGRMPIDYWGLGLMIAGLGALQLFLDKGQQEDWFASSFILVCAVVAFVALLLFAFVELGQEHPVVNLRLFKIPSFSVGVLLMFCFGFCLYSAIMLIPLMLQTLLGYDATLAGMVLAPGGVATLLTMPVVGLALKRFHPRWILLCGFSLAATAMFIMQGFSLQAAYWDFVWPRIVLGFGLGMMFVPLTTVTLSAIPKPEMGNATGIYNLMRNIGGSVGIATASTLLARFQQFYQTMLVGHISPYDSAAMARIEALTETALLQGGDPVAAEQRAHMLLGSLVRQQAGMLSFNRIFWFLGLTFLILIPFLFLLRRTEAGGEAVGGH